jgi:hypothetical protein
MSKRLIGLLTLILFLPLMVQAQTIDVQLPTIEGNKGDTITAAVVADDFANKGVYAITMEVAYDSSMVEIIDMPTANSIFSSLNPTKASYDSTFRVAGYSANEIDETGDLIYIQLYLKGSGETTLSFKELLFEGPSPVSTNGINGSVDISGDEIRVSFEDKNVAPKESFKLSVDVDDIAASDSVTSLDLVFDLDETQVEVTKVEISNNFSNQGIAVIGNQVDDKYNVALYSDNIITGSGSLLSLTMSAKTSGTIDFSLESASFNEGSPESKITSGTINSASVFVAIEDFTGTLNDTVLIPVTTTALDTSVQSYEFNVSYDSSKIDVIGAVSANSLTAEWNNPIINSISTSDGIVTKKVAAYGDSTEVESSGTVVFLQTVLKDNGEHTLSFVGEFSFDENKIAVIEQNGTITVQLASAPEFTNTLSDTTVAENETLSYQYTAVDQNGRELSYSITEGPEAAEINDSGLLTWTPDFDDSYNSPYSLLITATSKEGLIDTTRASVSVTNVNRVPTFTSVLPDTSLNEGDTLSFTYVATDEDVSIGADTLTYSLHTAPTGTTLDSVTGVLGFTIPEGAAGDHVFTVIASDNYGGADTTSATLTVIKPTNTVTFEVYMDIGASSDASYDSTSDDVYISGDLLGWVQPGEVESYKLSKVEDETGIFTIDFELASGSYLYKFFAVPQTGNATWDRGEWPGDPNRSITVSNDTTVKVLFGLKPGENLDIDVARTIQVGAPLQVTGTVTTPDFGYNNGQFYMQDATGGIQIYYRGVGGGNTETPFAATQNLTIVGEMDEFNNSLQIAPNSYTINAAQSNLPAPIILKGEVDWSADSEYQGMRVTLENMVLPESSEWPTNGISSGSGFNTDLVGTMEQYGTINYQVRIDRDESYFDGSERPTGNFNITGVMGQFRETTQIFPFFADEISIATSNEEMTELPEVFELSQNYPNPFNPTTSINYALPQASFVTLEVYNLLGQKVATLVNGQVNAGYHTVSFDASNLSSGIYIYRIAANDYASVKRMMLIK